LGDYFVVDTGRNIVVDTKVKLEVLARQLGVLQNWEELHPDRAA
jgi:hypothetical protein